TALSTGTQSSAWPQRNDTLSTWLVGPPTKLLSRSRPTVKARANDRVGCLLAWKVGNSLRWPPDMASLRMTALRSTLGCVLKKSSPAGVGDSPGPAAAAVAPAAEMGASGCFLSTHTCADDS